MDELTKRNFHALSEGLKDVRSKESQLTIKVNQLEQQVGQLQQQVITLQQQVGILLARVQGSGATARV